MTPKSRASKAAAVRPVRRLAPKRTAPASVGFPVVGLGASAGGLDAFKKLFTLLPADSGMAFVLIQHLDPAHESMMVELLGSHTAMKVLQATDGMRVEPNHIYVIPPRAYLSIKSGSLHLSVPREKHGTRMPIDFFLRSLAEECGERAICVILSGTGSDGNLGLKAVNEKGGVVIVQDPSEAAYDGMPRSAIATGDVDFILPVKTIPDAFKKFAKGAASKGKHAAGAVSQSSQANLAEIIELLRARTPHNFALYKPGTLLRRMERRMAIAGIAGIDRYTEILREDAKELERLAKDLLIHVTSFFRDTVAFETLAASIVPELVRERTSNQPLRIWIPACSTGEETYSVVILFLEAIAASKRNIKLQVFASDIEEDAVRFARNGLYPASIEAEVSKARLTRFFVKDDNGYRVRPELRKAVIFTVQDILADPPFSHIDLISCRNLLIYLRADVQEKVFSLFHFALRAGGILFLGASEKVGSAGAHFEPISDSQPIYRHIGHNRPGEVEFPIVANQSARTLPTQTERLATSQITGLGDLSQRLLLDTYAPASVLINRKCEGLYFFGATDRYLQIAAGDANRDILAMAREGLRTKLRSAIQQAAQDHLRVALSGAHVSRDGRTTSVGVDVRPVKGDGAEMYLVSFIDEPESSKSSNGAVEPKEDPSRIVHVERELEATKAKLQSAIRALETSNEALKAINEEAMSVNEEFQSTNEELETSHEELQSLNEELTALNGQLQETVEQQRRAANDLQNILNSANIATVFCDEKLNIRFFTPAAKSHFNFIGTDVGRPLADLARRSDDPDLLIDVKMVLASPLPLSREIEGASGTWFIRRVMPYRRQDGGIEGVVITFADISELKLAEREIEAARSYSDSIVETIRQPLVVLDEELRVISASSAFYRTFGAKPEEAVGRVLGTAGAIQFKTPLFRTFLDKVQTRSANIDDQEVEIELPPHGRRSLLLSARHILGPAARRKILLTIDDITERKRISDVLESAKLQAERANLGKSRFLAAASHDLRQPLQTLGLLRGILAKTVKDASALTLIGKIDETLGVMSGMLDTLLDINQLEAGVVRPEIVAFPISALLNNLKTEFAYHATSNGLVLRSVPSNLSVRSDPRLLEQMIRNLLSNAVKYTPHGKILFGCRRSGDTLRIEVWDTGLGIPAEHLQEIFQEFHQVDNPARERSQGLGLGLAIVHRIASMLGHAIDVRSRPGKGSTFIVEVPLVRGKPGVWAGNQRRMAQDNSGRPGTVLIVEDDPAVREMLELLFKAEGHRTLTAVDGPAALQLTVRGLARPNIVIADYNLPGGMTGLQCIAELRKGLHREIPAIILTGDISTEALRKIAQQNCVHLNKPAKAEELTQLVGALMSTSHRSNGNGHAFAAAARVEKPPVLETTGDNSAPAIFVVDDDADLRESMRGLLALDGRAVVTYPSGEAFLASYNPERKGCLVVDARMPGMGGLALLERLKERNSSLPAIVITGHGDVTMAVRAMKIGAVDFIEKPVDADELVASIERALERNVDSAKHSARRAAAAKCIAELTPREHAVMDMVLAGNPSKNIAADLRISQRTVENHRASIMRKTGSKSIPALIRMALASA